MSKYWNSGMKRAGHGRTMLQMPMHCYPYPEWEEAMRTGVPKGIKKCLSARNHYDDDLVVGTNRLQTSLALLFANTDQLLMQALGAHAHAYGQAANTEAGFDLDIFGQQILIGDAPHEYVIFFATMRAEAYERLLQIDVTGLFKELVRMRRERLSATGFYGRIPKSEILMDLLCAALPNTTQTFRMSTPAEIVDLFVEARLARFIARPYADVDWSDLGSSKH